MTPSRHRVIVAVLLCSAAYPAPLLANETGDSADAERGTIIVTATRAPIAAEDAPVTVTVIDEEQIADELVTDIKDLVRFEPGVSVPRQPSRFGAAFASTGRAGNEGFTIRGIGGNRVLIQVDGVRVPDGFSFGAQNAGRGDYVDLGLVKSVEILRGPGSALYGSDGLSGVVSFVTSDPDDLIAEGQSIGGLARASYSSADNEFSETAIVAGRSGALSAMAAYTRRDFKELENQGSNDVTGSARTTPNPQDGRSDAFLGKLVYDAGGGHMLRLTGEYLNTELATNVLSGLGPSGFGPTVVDALTASDSGKRTRIGGDWTYVGAGDGGFEYAHVAAYWQSAKDRQFADEDRSPSVDRERLNTFDNRIYGASAEARLRFDTGRIAHRITVGGDVSQTRQQGLRDGVTPPAGETFPARAFPVTDYLLAGAYIGDEISIGDGRILLYPALRFDYYSLDPQADSLLPASFVTSGQSDSRLSPKFGIVVKLTDDVRLFGNYARGFKSPSPSQVNNFFENLAFGYTSLPNPNLGPETSESYEGGIRFTNDAISLSATGFTGNYDNFINQKVVSGSFRPGDPAVFQFVNLDRVKVKGLEGKFEARADNGLTANMAIAYATGDVIAPDGSRTPLSTIDPLKLVMGAGYHAPSGNFGGQVVMTHSARKEARRDPGDCNGPCFRPAAYTILDATAFVRVADSITLRAGIFNITDQKYANYSDVRGLSAASTITDAYTAPGRNASVSLSFKF